MMKNLLFLKRKAFIRIRFIAVIVAVSIAGSIYAQSHIELEAERTQTMLKESNLHSIEVFYSFDVLKALNVETERGEFHELFISNTYSVGQPGTPKLPAAKNLIEIPFGAEVNVEVISYDVSEYKLGDYGLDKLVMPVQPSLRKDLDVSDVPFRYEPEAYSLSRFGDMEIADVEILGVLRGMRLARLTVAPVRYNPVEGTIRVYNNIEVRVNFENADFELTRYIKASTFSPYFDVLYSRILNAPTNRDIFDNYPDLTKNPIKMLIVSHRDFEETLEPFIEWKTMQGYFLNVAYTDEIGTTAAAIKTWIHNQYNDGTPDDPAPTFLVLVGDPGKLPASQTGSASNRVTDLYYASVDGDYFPEMYYGRLSARNTQELQNQIDKILYYQKYEFDDPSYLDDVTLIAGQDGFWNPAIGQPTVHYGTQNYFNAAHGFNNVNAYLSSYTGCYDNERISVSFINFTAHCSPTAWAGPYLYASDIHNMTNTGKYPLAVGNCCQSALFSHTESIGEAWVRAANKGAVAYIGSAPNTHWFEDFYWAVGAFPITGNNSGYVPTVEETTLGVYDAMFTGDYMAVASRKFVGNLAITEAHLQSYPTHSNVQWYWEGYHTFGDPSTYIYLTQGSENEVSHMPILPIGLDTYTVEAFPGSYVAISKDGVLHGAAFVDVSGEVEVPIEPVLDGGDVTIVVTKPQYIPYIQTIPAAALEGPFVVLDHYEINNPEEAFIYGETVTIDVTIKNVGADDATSISGTLVISDPYFTLVNTEPVVFGPVNAGDTGNTTTVQNAFTLQVAANVPDQHQATFVLDLTDGENQWQSNLRATANAPKIEFLELTIEDDGSLNPGVLDPGESADLVIVVKNTGHAATGSVEVNASSPSPWLNIQQDSETLEVLAPGESAEASFFVTASSNAPPEVAAQIVFTAQTGEYNFSATKEIIIGQAPVYDGGDIPTTYNTSVTPSSNALEPGVLTVTIPENAVITGVDVEYKMTAQGGGWTSEQRSFIRCVSPGGTTEPQVASGSGNSAGTYDYNRTGLTIANGVEGGGEITFELHAFRTWGGSGSNTTYNFVPNNTWKVVVHYEIEGYSVSFNVTDNNGNPISDAVLIFDGHTYPQGVYTVDGLEEGTYIYEITKPGYCTITGEVEVIDENVFIDVVMHKVFAVTFNIIDNFGNEVHDAVITLEEDTHEAGHYHFDEIATGFHNYLIQHEDYHDYSGTLFVSTQDVEVNVTLIHIQTSIEEFAEGINVNVFPNPAREKVILDIKGNDSPFIYSLTNYQGQILHREEITPAGQQQFNINLRRYSAGIYYLRLDFKDSVVI
ncbi:MAG: T9SS C-terminal target domain-containing protein, partial [Bacteroidetes bacterium]